MTVLMNCTFSYLNANHVNESDSRFIPSQSPTVKREMVLSFFFFGSVPFGASHQTSTAAPSVVEAYRSCLHLEVTQDFES